MENGELVSYLRELLSSLGDILLKPTTAGLVFRTLTGTARCLENSFLCLTYICWHGLEKVKAYCHFSWEKSVYIIGVKTHFETTGLLRKTGSAIR